MDRICASHHRHWHHILVIMSSEDSYKTISKSANVEFKEKSSRFIGLTFHVKDEMECKSILQELRSAHPSANHVCYAFRIGVQNVMQRSSDAGEPAGSAGEPILRQLIKYDLTFTLVAVVRYFGGKKLGVSGLINAYKQASSQAISESAIKNEYLYLTVELKFPYKYIDVVMRSLDMNKAKILSRTFEQSCSMTCSVRKGKLHGVKNDFDPYHEIQIVEL